MIKSAKWIVVVVLVLLIVIVAGETGVFAVEGNPSRADIATVADDYLGYYMGFDKGISADDYIGVYSNGQVLPNDTWLNGGFSCKAANNHVITWYEDDGTGKPYFELTGYTPVNVDDNFLGCSNNNWHLILITDGWMNGVRGWDGSWGWFTTEIETGSSWAWHTRNETLFDNYVGTGIQAQYFHYVDDGGLYKILSWDIGSNVWTGTLLASGYQWPITGYQSNEGGVRIYEIFTVGEDLMWGTDEAEAVSCYVDYKYDIASPFDCEELEKVTLTGYIGDACVMSADNNYCTKSITTTEELVGAMWRIPANDDNHSVWLHDSDGQSLWGYDLDEARTDIGYYCYTVDDEKLNYCYQAITQAGLNPDDVTILTDGLDLYSPIGTGQNAYFTWYASVEAGEASVYIDRFRAIYQDYQKPVPTNTPTPTPTETPGFPDPTATLDPTLGTPTPTQDPNSPGPTPTWGYGTPTPGLPSEQVEVSGDVYEASGSGFGDVGSIGSGGQGYGGVGVGIGNMGTSCSQLNIPGFDAQDFALGAFDILGIAPPNLGWQASTWAVCVTKYDVSFNAGFIDLTPYVVALMPLLALVIVAMVRKR